MSTILIVKADNNNNFAFNFLGAFECACPRGFRQMGDRCVDVDECIEQQGDFFE